MSAARSRRDAFHLVKSSHKNDGWYLVSIGWAPVGPYPSQRAAADGAERLATSLRGLDEWPAHPAPMDLSIETRVGNNTSDPCHTSIIESELRRLERIRSESDLRWWELAALPVRTREQNCESHELSVLLPLVARRIVELRNTLALSRVAPPVAGERILPRRATEPKSTPTSVFACRHDRSPLILGNAHHSH
jgi:hypothetical protein